MSIVSRLLIVIEFGLWEVIELEVRKTTMCVLKSNSKIWASPVEAEANRGGSEVNISVLGLNDPGAISKLMTNITNLCGFGSDGAAVMIGKKNGVEAKLREILSRMIILHSSEKSRPLVLQTLEEAIGKRCTCGEAVEATQIANFRLWPSEFEQDFGDVEVDVLVKQFQGILVAQDGCGWGGHCMNPC
ncbi:hypothetical protein GQR58_025705 [Nymphon striatum]|nr:hypothetical protein GQR58_025705 [Nymphon striatum]